MTGKKSSKAEKNQKDNVHSWRFVCFLQLHSMSLVEEIISSHKLCLIRFEALQQLLAAFESTLLCCSKHTLTILCFGSYIKELSVQQTFNLEWMVSLEVWVATEGGKKKQSKFSALK